MIAVDKIQYLQIGVQGENVARTVDIDMSEWALNYPDADFHVLFVPYNETVPIPQTTVYSPDTMVLQWTVGFGATAVPGVGYTEIRAQNAETGLLRKTKIIPTAVENSVSGVSAYPPDAYADWVTSVLNAATAVLAAAHGASISFSIGGNGHLIFSYTNEDEETVTVDLGPVDAFGMAKEAGYSRTRAQFEDELANTKNYADAAEAAAAAAELAKTYAQLFTGAPRAAATAADMTDHDLIYVFTGTTTSDLTNGYWYYWDGEDWAEGGAYNSTALTTDTTLSVEGAAADAKKTGDELSSLKSAITSQYSSSTTYEVGDYAWYNGYVYKCTKSVTTAETFDVNKWVVVTEASELKKAYQLLSCSVPTSDAELNSIIKRLYIPSSVSVDLSVVNRVTIYNGAASLYGFRFFNSSNVKQLDFTKSSTFTGLTKIGNVIADIGDLSAVNGTSKNYYCTVYNSVLYLTELATDYEAFESDVKHRIAPEFSTSQAYNAGQYVWYNNVLQKFVSAHSAGAYVVTEMAAVDNGLSYDLYNVALMFALPYDASSTYSVGDFCTWQNRFLYKCKTAINTAETFTPAHWTRVFLTDIIKLENSFLEGMAVSSSAELNKIIKRLYIPASASIDISTVTRVTVYNGFSNLYGFRLFNSSNTQVLNFALPKSFNGYEKTVSGCYTEISDLSLIDGTSQNFYCSIYPSVYEENNIIADYLASKNAPNNTTFGTYTPTAQSDQGQNVGETITVMSYNVAHYNNDVSSVIIPAEKVKNIISTISKVNADFICVQEDDEFIDSDHSPQTGRYTSLYIYYPQYPNSVTTSACNVRSKQQVYNNTYGSVKYSTGRWIAYGVFAVGDKKLLVCSTHPIADVGQGTESAESIAARLVQYTELFKWIKGEIDLDDTSSGNDVHVPEHTHVVIGIDANSLTDDDKENLSDLASEYHYVMGNGGRLGWLKTGRDRYEWFSIDNIIVSNNIIINSFESMTDKYSDLYSDHVPVVAKITLLGS